MDFAIIAAAFLISTGNPPLDPALVRTEPPTSLRAAFTVELTDGEAFREVQFDPRISDPGGKWVVLTSEGDSEELDKVVKEWGGEIAPDGWLFPDDLRASMGRIVEAEDTGALWKVEFEHQPSDNDGPMDIWASDHLIGYAWLDPINHQFVRVEYEALEPFDAPTAGRVDSYSHAYILHDDPRYGISFVSAYMIDVKGTLLNETIERSYRARITDVDFFFSSPVEEALFLSRQRGNDPAAIGVTAYIE